MPEQKNRERFKEEKKLELRAIARDARRKQDSFTAKVIDKWPAGVRLSPEVMRALRIDFDDESDEPISWESLGRDPTEIIPSPVALAERVEPR
jgi:hypothetical protein